MTSSPDREVALGTAATRGVLWLGGGQILRQVVQIVGSIVLARLLSPDDFGLLGMALFFVGIGQLFAEFGVGAAIIQAQAHDRVVLSSCFWLNLGLALGIAVLVAAAAPWIADFYGRTDLSLVVIMLSGNLVLSALIVIPSTLLSRDLRFGEVARANVLGSLMGALVAVAMAWRGAGIWALVAQPLVGSVVLLVLLIHSAKWVPSLQFSWAEVKPYARFGLTLLASNLINYANRNVDRLLVGRYIGAAPLGVYSMAMQMMLYPLQHVSAVIVRVLFPTMSKLKDDPVRLRSAYLTATGSIALVTFPLLAGLFAVANDFVAVVFGQAWLEMVPVVQVLTWAGIAQSVGTTVGTVYLSCGRPDLALKLSVAVAPILIGGMVIGVPWGVQGVAVGYSVASLLIFHVVAWRALRLIEMAVGQFYAVLYRPFLASMVMILAVLALGRILIDVSVLIRLIVCILTGGVTYVLFSLVINRAQLVNVATRFLEATGRRWKGGRIVRCGAED